MACLSSSPVDLALPVCEEQVSCNMIWVSPGVSDFGRLVKGLSAEQNPHGLQTGLDDEHKALVRNILGVLHVCVDGAFKPNNGCGQP